MPNRVFIVPPIEVEDMTREPIGRAASDETLIFEGVSPDPGRGLYRHCYGVRGFIWSVHGSFERTYYFAPDYVEGNLRDHLESTIVGLWAVIRSELESAVAAPNMYGEEWRTFYRQHVSLKADGDGGSGL